MRIKNIILLSLFWIAFLTAVAQRQNINVQGAVVNNGKGVAGVAVTDGVSVVKTDAKGEYILATGSDRDIIYYTLPSGFESPVVDGVPVFYKAIDKSNPKQKINFEITKSEMPQNAHAFIACADPQVLDFEDFEKLKLVVADMKETADRLKTETPVHAISLGDLVFDRLKIFEHVHAAASGAWWQGEISTDGSPKGYTVYKVDGDELSWYFKGVGLTEDKQFKLYPAGSDELYPDCIIANVYNYDPEWQVNWYENRVLMGEMQQYWGKDPLAAEMYQPGKNKRHSWLSSSQTNHLFRASVKDPNAQISVVVNNRFGNEYKEILAPVAQKNNNEGWKLIWSDEFSISGLPDSTKWNYDTRGNEYGWGNNELQWYTVANPENAWISNGILKITARHEPTHGKEYSSARLTTKNKGDWKYGKFEIRAKMPAGRGTWPAIWMLPTVNNYGGWPHSGEIDIMEHVGYDPDTVHSTVHTTKFNHMIGTQVGKPIFVKTATTEFHVYTTEWDEDEIRSYVDGQLYFIFKNDGTGHEAWPFDQPFHLILNLAIGGGWGGKKGIDDTLFPHVFEIDYVRVYQPVDQ